MKCKKCGSMAINHHLHGRDGRNPDLCDVCYWRDKADQYNQLKWTKEKPTIDGWYWFHPTDEDTRQIEKATGKALYWPIEINEGMIFEDGQLIDWEIQGEYQEIKQPEGI